MSDVERASGAARRRRERRLRSWLKHERQAVRMVLAETFDHSSAPFPPKARAARRPTGTEHGKDHGRHVLHVEDQCGRGYGVLLAVRRGRRRVGYAADRSGPAAGTARACPAARRGAACLLCSKGTDPRRTSTADGGPAGRACDRSAQDPTGLHPRTRSWRNSWWKCRLQ